MNEQNQPGENFQQTNQPSPDVAQPVVGSAPQRSVSTKTAVIIVFTVGALVVASCAVYLYFFLGDKNPAPTALEEVSPPPPPQPPPARGLGSELYAILIDPLDGKLPSNVAPVSNPLEDAYVNPFE